MERDIQIIVKKVEDGHLNFVEATKQILLLFRSEQLKCDHNGRRKATELVEYCEDCKKILFHP